MDAYGAMHPSWRLNDDSRTPRIGERMDPLGNSASERTRLDYLAHE